MIHGGRSNKVNILQTACPVKVQHVPEVRQQLGEYTLPVYPIDRDLYHKLLRNKEKLMPKGLTSIGNHSKEDLWKGLPIDGKNYYVTLDKDGNICFPGQQSWSANQLDSAIKSTEAHDKSDVELIITVAKKLIKQTDPGDVYHQRVSKLLAKLQQAINVRRGRRRNIPEPEQEMLTDTRNAFMATLSTGANKTAGCAPILGQVAAYDDADLDSRVKGMGSRKLVGNKPSESKVNIPITELEDSQDRYGLGRWPHATGDGPESVVCRTPEDIKNPFLSALLKKTRKIKQDPQKVARGAIEYGDKNISQHAAEGFACVNATREECEDAEYDDIKIPYGKNNSNKTMSDFCTWDSPLTQPNEAKRCMPKSWQEVTDVTYRQDLEDWYLDMVEPNYDEWANKRQPNSDIQLKRDMGRQFKRKLRYEQSN